METFRMYFFFLLCFVCHRHHPQLKRHSQHQSHPNENPKPSAKSIRQNSHSPTQRMDTIDFIALTGSKDFLCQNFFFFHSSGRAKIEYYRMHTIYMFAIAGAVAFFGAAVLIHLKLKLMPFIYSEKWNGK